jgi:peptidoglycan endopeptidase LytE
MKKLILAFLFVSTLEARPPSGVYANPDVDELRIELEDIKHALHSTQVELSLLDEKQKKQNSKPGQEAPLSALEKKISSLEKNIDKITTDLRTLSTSLNQTLSQIQHLETHLSTHDEKFSEVSKLKTTLTSISKAMTPAEAPSAKTYRVKAGDTLEKIARTHHTSAEALRKLNHLSSDKIVVGQNLRLHDDPS